MATIAHTIDDSVAQELADGLQGRVLRPGQDGYDAARALWNGMIDRSPGLIARCASTADVVHAVNVARTHDLPLAVRGGGHNAAGNASCDGGLVIDLSEMRAVTVDPERRRAHAQGGATWADFDAATQAHGLATTGGAISTTGVAGLTLGGGLGYLMRSHGLACDNLVGAEVVTADGSVAHASDVENPDLLWGLRGGGGNFGVVTSFEFKLHPVGPILGGLLVHPRARAREVLQFYRDFNASAPDELTSFAAMMRRPDGADVVALIVAYNGPQAEGEQVLKPLREFGPPLADMVQPMPYPALQSMLDEGFPHGLQVYWRSDFLRGLQDDFIDTIIEQAGRCTSPLSAVLIEQLGGAVARVPDNASAFGHRDAEYNLAIIARWGDPAEAQQHIAWARGLHTAIKPYARGVYVNYLGEEGEDRVKAAYGPDTYAKLVALKNRYDPHNLFRINQNIKPTV
jgi:FAD/FMN-containing dehydrogenase